MTAKRLQLLSVVIPTYKRVAWVTRLVKTLLKQTSVEHDVEIIVVDNAGEEAVRSAVRKVSAEVPPRVTYVHEARPGVSHVRNTGLKEAAGNFVAFVDDDVIVCDGWLNAVATNINDNPSTSFFGGRIDPVNDDLQPVEVAANREAFCGVLRYPEQSFEIDDRAERMVISGNLVVERASALKIGGFHTAFQRRGTNIGSIEDQEFIVRYTSEGYTGRYDASIAAITIVPSERLRNDYAERWQFGHGYYTVQLDYRMTALRDRRAQSPSTSRTLAPLWAVRELLGTNGNSDVARFRRSYLRGYIRGALALMSSNKARQRVLAAPSVS